VKGAATVAFALSTLSSITFAQDNVSLKVVGTWGNLNAWKKAEKPFWSDQVPKESNGTFDVDAKSMTDLGLKGFEVMRMLQLGVFDVGHGIISYLSEDPVAEGIDLAGVVQDWDTAELVVNSYREVLSNQFDATYKTKLLAIYPFPSQVMYCNKPISSIKDLKGMKVRSYSKSMADLLSGLGATGVTLPFAEVVPALQLGTVDCGVTGTFPAFTAKWHEVTTHLYKLQMGYAFSYLAINGQKWASLSQENKDFLISKSKEFELKAWSIAKEDDAQGISCLAGERNCKSDAAGSLVKVVLSDDDNRVRREVLEASVLKNYGQRCGKECSENWNNTIGAATGLKITQ